VGNLKYKLIRAGMELFALPGVSNLIRSFSASRGVFFTMHRVLPGVPAAFSPNSILQITPEFLEETILACRAQNVDIVDIDEALRRLSSQQRENRFAVFSFDDGYKDNLEFALPILRKHNCPFTLYIATNLIEAKAEVWWQAIEDIIANSDAIEFDFGKGVKQYSTQSISAKWECFDEIYDFMREAPEAERLEKLTSFAKAYGLDLEQHCRDLIMDWEELQNFIDEPLCTIGAHTVNHYELKKLSSEAMRAEIQQSVEILTKKTGSVPTHFSYPVGGNRSAGRREFAAVKELGLHSGVTTRPGGLYKENAEFPNALPRVSINGNYQKKRFLNVFLTGAIFTTHSGGKKVNHS